MNSKTLIILFLLSVGFQSAFSQVKFKYGINFGLTFSQFPKNDPFTDIPNEVNEKILPRFSPLVGFQSKVLTNSPISFTSALQYQVAGTRYRYHHEGTQPAIIDGPTTLEYSLDISEKQTFHKICLPFTIDYSFKVWKVSSSISIGYRFNYFFTGKHYYKYDYETNYDSVDSKGEYEFNPLDSNQFGDPGRRFHNQFLLGYSVLLRKNLELGFSFNKGKVISYSPNSSDPEGFSMVRFSYENVDWIIQVNYILGK